MNTIIDGYNLIFTWGWHVPQAGSRALEQARQRLIRELGMRIPAEGRGKMVIVFDANVMPIKETSSRAIVNGFHVVFAHQHDDADALIEEMIRRHANPKSLTVVSSDNRLKNAAQRRNAIAINSEDWLDELEIRFHPSNRNERDERNDISPKEQAMRELSTTDWLAEFKINDPNTLLPDSRETLDRDSPDWYNPFPPGYGDDVTEE